MENLNKVIFKVNVFGLDLHEYDKHFTKKGILYMKDFNELKDKLNSQYNNDGYKYHFDISQTISDKES